MCAAATRRRTHCQKDGLWRHCSAPSEREPAPHAVREYLTRSNEENGEGDNGGSSGGRRGGRRPKPPKEVSLTDPQATWIAAPGVDAFFAYDANYLIDYRVGIIIDAEATRANRVVEISVTRTMIERVARRFWSASPTTRGRHRLWRGRSAQVASRSASIWSPRVDPRTLRILSAPRRMGHQEFLISISSLHIASQ